MIKDSAYGQKMAVSGALAGSKIAAATGIGLALGIGGTALGGAIIYYGTGDTLYVWPDNCRGQYRERNRYLAQEVTGKHQATETGTRSQQNLPLCPQFTRIFVDGMERSGHYLSGRLAHAYCKSKN